MYVCHIIFIGTIAYVNWILLSFTEKTKGQIVII